MDNLEGNFILPKIFHFDYFSILISFFLRCGIYKNFYEIRILTLSQMT